MLNRFFAKGARKTFWVYDSPVHSNYRMLLYMLAFAFFALFLLGDFYKVLWFIIIPIFFLIASISAFVVVDNKGITAYTLLKKPQLLRWDKITHYGTVIKGKGLMSGVFLYFSSKPLITAPHESLPAINKELVYLSSNAQLRDSLLLYWDKEKVKALFQKTKSKDTVLKTKQVHLNLLLFVAVLFALLYKQTGRVIWVYCIAAIATYVFVAVVVMLCSSTGDGLREP